MTTNGLTSEQFKRLLEFKKIANDEQLEAIINDFVNEQDNRNTLRRMN